MEDTKLIKIMHESGFTDKQIDKLTARYKTLLYCAVDEAASRLPRAIFVHVFVLLIIGIGILKAVHEGAWHPAQLIIFALPLVVACGVSHHFAPLSEVYKAAKVMKKIKHQQVH